MDLAALLETAGPMGAVIAVVIYLTIKDFLYPKYNKKNGTKTTYRYNPHPPGESVICRENRDMIIEAKSSIRDIERRLESIEEKL